ncbi:MAG: ABC transporter ATP-binding protein, partial [Planctomycetes bacterium]|nr:ABC transporter ATP-binding protein [Planctomycetota bacterium]
LVAFLLYIPHVNGSVQRLSDSMMELQDGVAALDRIHDIHSIMPAPPEACKPIYPDLHGNIRFDNVTFAYDEKNPVLHNFSYNFEAGKSYALVGPSGGGKSTITQLMLRFYDPQEGSILIDDHPLMKVGKQHYRSNVSVVLQDPIIFSGTVAENIGFADADAGFERIQQAARDAQADEFITSMPKGYDSRLGERGVALSGGQRQRIAIARALMRDPKLLILDEATSALDTITERSIQQVTEKLQGTRTMIVIAHRLSTIRTVDKILVIEDGRLIEEGSYDELIAAHGHFSQLAAEEQEHAA